MNKFKLSKYYKSESHIENAKKGSIIGSIRSKELKIERIKKYNENPNICLNCQKIIEYEKKSNKYCCASCGASYSNKIKGKKSDETKYKISIKLRNNNGDNPKIVEKQCSFCYNKFSIEWKNRKHKCCSLSCAAKYRMTDKIKERLSEITSNRIKNGAFKPKLTSIKCLYEFNDKKIRCDSKVEYSCLNYFENNFEVLDIERCDFLIDFDYKGINKKYNPDFKIITKNSTYIVECKTILSSKELVRKWSYYYDTIEDKKLALDKYCKDNNFISFNYNKSMNNKFYNICSPKIP